MNLYLPTDLLSLREEIDSCGMHAAIEHDSDEALWLGGEAYVASSLFGDRPTPPLRRTRRSELRSSSAELEWLPL